VPSRVGTWTARPWYGTSLRDRWTLCDRRMGSGATPKCRRSDHP
jgi:hypothetical protein